MTRVLASATVDVIRHSAPLTFGVYHVEVWGKPPYDYVRTYKLHAKNETAAAQEAIAKFVEEMEALELPDDDASC
jgi:hypothetical protein